jgi:hypothetical protein
MAKYAVIRPGIEWRGVVRVVADSGDELDRAGISEIIVELQDTLPHPGVPETARAATIWADISDCDAETHDKSLCEFMVPNRPNDTEGLAREAVREFLKIRAGNPTAPTAWNP